MVYEAELKWCIEFNKNIISITRKPKEERAVIQEEFRDLDSDISASVDTKGSEDNDDSEKKE